MSHPTFQPIQQKGNGEKNFFIVLTYLSFFLSPLHSFKGSFSSTEAEMQTPERGCADHGEENKSVKERVRLPEDDDYM